jgi:hypothetical protein
MDFSYHNLIQLFDIQKYNSSPLIQMKCGFIKDNHPHEYPKYYKASKVLDCVHTLIETNRLVPNDKVIDRAIDSIVSIPSFENYSVSDLLKRTSIEPVVQAYTTPITHGKLNTIKRVTQPQNLHLNSFFRQQPSSSTDFDIILPREITHVSSMRLASIELPNTRLLISCKQNNNTFQLKIGTDLYNFEVPDGNYSTDTLTTTLNGLLDAQNTNVEFTLDSQFHTTLTKKTGIDVTFTFYPKSIGWMLGFRKTVYLDSEGIVSEGLYDLIGDRYVYLSIEDYQYNTNINNIVCLDRSYVDKSILAKVPTNDEKYALIIYDTDPLSKKRIYNGPVTLKKLHVTLLDKFCKVIDLQQMDFSFTLELELIYENF